MKQKNKHKATTKAKKSTVSANLGDSSSTYLLKLVLYLIIGSQWIRIVYGDNQVIPIPIGLIFGLLFASHEHFQVDRKIEYAVLIVVMFISFWLPIGIDVILPN